MELQVRMNVLPHIIGMECQVQIMNLVRLKECIFLEKDGNLKVLTKTTTSQVKFQNEQRRNSRHTQRMFFHEDRLCIECQGQSVYYLLRASDRFLNIEQ